MKQFNNLTILAIDTSCDDTCIAILEMKNCKLKILSNIVSSQVKLHAKYGGVYPTLAKREHQRNLVPVLNEALKKSKLLKISKSKFLISKQIPNSKFQTVREILPREEYLFKELNKFFVQYEKPKIDLITVTVGPGLEPCLWVGVNFAKALSYFWNLPIIPINHIEAHILANWLPSVRFDPQLPIANHQLLFPAVCLIVSGGHTQLILIRDFAPVVERNSLRGYPEANSVLLRGGKYKILGETRDDAAGECFDKVARILGLGYPGGPRIEKLSKIYYLKSKIYKIKLPRPMINQKNFDFSFSGLKTAVLYDFKNRLLKVRQSREYIRAMAAEIQRAIVDVLISKTFRAAKKFNAKTIIIGGGVAANEKLRKQFKVQSLRSKVNFFVPPKKFCTDNATMVGITAFFHYLKGESRDWQKILVNANLRLG